MSRRTKIVLMSSERHHYYLLFRADTLLGVLAQTDSHNDWHHGRFKPSAGFQTVRHLFDRERELYDSNRLDEWASLWEEIAAPGMRLEPVAGGEHVHEFLIHIEGKQARWRF